MSAKKFIKKSAVKIIIFVCVMVFVTAILNSIAPIVSNQLALGQMYNSDEMYILMNTYNKIKPIGNAIIVAVSALFIGHITTSSYKFYKTNIKEKNENEED